MSARVPLYYTFGNHMHWVDMEWLWGYHVLPGSIRDMLRFCRETGTKGNVNFDGIGYEKLAAEDPEALLELRAAVLDGTIEPVGCSYGQPYGLFHGGESNVRQRIYGVRAVRRLLGVWPKAFWEEEFDFFPQLPQMLRGVGFEYASLFFQWTWHTPEIPKEDVPVVLWEGQDGSRLVTATRNRMNLHQWPEDMDILFNELASEGPMQSGAPLILQWLELMPSPDWMCRSEVLLPKMRELLADERFEIRPCTLSEYLQSSMGVPPMVSSAAGPQSTIDGRDAHATLPVRRYAMDDVWHGMTLGKNADHLRRRSAEIEHQLLFAESLAATAGLFGRPYAQWDVYPTWELEEAWRELLSAQHHDNDECEGLCGHIGEYSYDRAASLSQDVVLRSLTGVANRISGSDEGIACFNPLGWSCRWFVDFGDNSGTLIDVPAFGWETVSSAEAKAYEGSWTLEGSRARYRRGALEVEVNVELATITRLVNSAVPQSLCSEGEPLWRWVGLDGGGQPFQLRGTNAEVVSATTLLLHVEMEGHEDEGFTIVLEGNPAHEGISVRLVGSVPRPKAGLNDSFGFVLPVAKTLPDLKSDQPLGITEQNPSGSFLKKYPTGDWMTSPQWFETVDKPFTSTSFADFSNGNVGVMVAHVGARQWFVEADGSVRHVVSAYDPWDEEKDHHELDNGYLILPHGNVDQSELWKRAQELARPCLEADLVAGNGELPLRLDVAAIDRSNVVATAFYRETEDAGRHLDSYAGAGMGYPYILRLLELDGLDTEATISVSGTVASAHKTNLLGIPETRLDPSFERSADGHPHTGVTSTFKVRLGPYEIATVYLDIEEGRKQTRDLDAKREIWATVHRVDE